MPKRDNAHTALRIQLASDISAAAKLAYAQHVGGSLEALEAFADTIFAALTADVVEQAEAAAVTTEAITRAKAAAAKDRCRPLVAMPIDRVDDS